MAVGVRTQDLRKVYSSSPPLGAAGGFIARADAKGGTQPKAQIPALDGLSLEILPGEIFGLLGPNGAGKSTTVGVLTTRVRPTSGQAWIGEHDVWKEQVRVKYLIGVVPQRPNLDFSLTAREILVFHAAYFGIGSKQRNERADRLLEKFKLTERANQVVRASDSTGADVYADRGGSLISEIANLAANLGAELSDVHISEPSLENLFLHHTGRSLRD